MTPPAVRGHLALALVPGLGPKLTAALRARFGPPDDILRATAADLRTVPLIGEKLAGQFAAAFRTVDPDAEYAAAAAAGLSIIPLGDPQYPARLAAIPDPPPLLYVKGAVAPAEDRVVGLVGSRACTPYGLRVAAALAADLARAGWVVASGLARGIDGAAHDGCLRAGGTTWAVLAGGLGRIYPPEHKELAARVAAAGALITETPMTVAPQPGMFPARNRIISGLSRMVVVVEADVKSGALITVDHATDQGRDVGAVPGPVDAAASAGCNDLIRKGATLIRHADDILEAVRGLRPADPPPKREKGSESGPTLFPPAEPPPGLAGPAKVVWDALGSALQADELARTTGLGAAELGKVLMLMELKRQVRRLPGNRYERR